MFLEEFPKQLDEIRHALEQSDAVVLCRAAHTLKSSLAAFGAAGCVEFAKTLEQMGREARFEQAPQLLSQLATDLPQLAAELAAYARET